MARIIHATLADVTAELARGGIIEAPISAPGQHVSGYCDRDTEIVCVNPLPELADTLIHELVHRRWPRWGETRVCAETRHVMGTMTDADVAALVRSYRRRRHKRWRVEVLDSA
jgi:hypothetical protein